MQGRCKERVGGPANGMLRIMCAGVEPESRVVIYAETQRDWMVGAYAVWQLNGKAGPQAAADEACAVSVTVIMSACHGVPAGRDNLRYARP